MKNLQNEIESNIASKMMGVENGDEYAIEIYAMIKGIAAFCTDAMKELEADAFIDAEKNKGSIFHGYQVSTKDGNKVFSYDHIPAWVVLKMKMKDIESTSKQAWEMKQKFSNYVTDDGEIITPADMKYGKHSIVLTKVKK